MWSERRERERVFAFANDGRKEEEEEEGLCDQREGGREGKGVLLVIFVMGGGYGGREA